ncbi:hypothetical protein [Streptomyces sp. NPDC056660]|uniref:hypothetical protein n=1 Tax=Streptomyces sp. NPDC056660 TaxID=3345897 RepID=UPI0036B9881B
MHLAHPGGLARSDLPLDLRGSLSEGRDTCGKASDAARPDLPLDLRGSLSEGRDTCGKASGTLRPDLPLDLRGSLSEGRDTGGKASGTLRPDLPLDLRDGLSEGGHTCGKASGTLRPDLPLDPCNRVGERSDVVRRCFKTCCVGPRRRMGRSLILLLCFGCIISHAARLRPTRPAYVANDRTARPVSTFARGSVDPS